MTNGQREVVGVFGRLLRSWPTWALVVLVVLVLVGVTLAGKLDEWVAGIIGVAFVLALAVLIGRAAHQERTDQ